MIINVNTSFYGIRLPFNENFNAKIRKLPGAFFNRKMKYWQFPRELLSPVLEIAESCKFSVKKPNSIVVAGQKQIESKLFAFQKAAVDKIIQNNGGLLSFEMGLGKTPTSIVAIESVLSLKDNILVVCPANVRIQWAQQWRKWGKNRPTHIISKGKDYAFLDKDKEGSLIICSYGLLSSELESFTFGAIISDESQEIKNIKAKRTKEMLSLSSNNKNALKLALTGTPINEPKDFWSQLDFIYPKRYGSFWDFARRYCNMYDNGYGMTIEGVNEENRTEFAQRIETISMRVTRSDLPPGTIPPMTVSIEHIIPSLDNDVSMEKSFRSHENILDSAVLLCGYKKVDATQTKIDSLLKEDKEAPICILTYHIETAKVLAKVLNTKHICGETPIASRQEIAEEIINQDSAPRILVCTMKSIGVGVDYLTPFTRVVFAELYWSPIVMTQVVGRFSRLSSLSGVDLYFLVLQGTIDELISTTLKRKIENLNAVMQTTDAEKAIASTFSIDTKEEPEFLAELTKIASAYERTEYDD